MFFLNTKNILLVVIGSLALIELFNFQFGTVLEALTSSLKVLLFVSIFFLLKKYIVVESDEENKRVRILYDKLNKDKETGLFDKKALFEWYEAKRDYIERTDKYLSIVVVEVNENELNNNKSFSKDILLEMAKLIDSSTRKMIDFVVRIDANKFAVLCFEKEKDALIIGQRIQKKINDKSWAHNKPLDISIAVSEIDIDNEFKVELNYAERVLFDARKKTSNKIATRTE